MTRWVCLDIGETLVDETRVWSSWADVLGVPPFTLMAALGATIARGLDPAEAFPLVGCDDWRRHEGAVARRYDGFQRGDLYRDALPSLRALRQHGYRVAVMGNQPASRTAELGALGVDVDAIAMSDELGVHKPDPAFFTAVLERLGGPNPADVAYVGDRVDNDVEPAARAGLRSVWIRRGPWGRLQSDEHGAAALVVRTLFELVDRIEDAYS